MRTLREVERTQGIQKLKSTICQLPLPFPLSLGLPLFTSKSKVAFVF